MQPPSYQKSKLRQIITNIHFLTFLFVFVASLYLLVKLIHKVTPNVTGGEDALDVLLSVVVLVENVIELRVCLLELHQQSVLLICLALH